MMPDFKKKIASYSKHFFTTLSNINGDNKNELYKSIYKEKY